MSQLRLRLRACVEPFLRAVAPIADAGLLAEGSLRVPLGPTYPPLGASWGTGFGRFLGAQLALGAVYD